MVFSESSCSGKPSPSKIHTLGGFSAHAGRNELLEWAGGFENRPRFYLVHGEPGAMDILGRAMRDKLGTDAVIPEKGDQITF